MFFKPVQLHCCNRIIRVPQMRVVRLAEEWKNMPEDKKQAFFDEAKELLNNFLHDTREWEKSMLKKFKYEDDEIESLLKVSTIPVSYHFIRIGIEKERIVSFSPSIIFFPGKH